ncbi:hypothetical protein KM043_000950 [Ampulex compressa]|nr:hypothetical protein KM043_000950 [Ampulex compressa]
MESNDREISTSTIGRGLRVALRCVGLWPDIRFALFYKFYWLSSMAVFQLFQYRYVITRLGTVDLSSLVDSLSTTVAYTLLSLKLATLWRNERVLRDVLASMARDWQENGAIGLKVRIMRRVAQRSSRVSNIIMGLNSTSAVLYAAGIVLSNVQGGKDSEVASRELPLKIQLPFDIGDSPLFETVFVVEFLHQVGAATASGMTSALLLTLVFHLGGQLDIIRHDLVYAMVFSKGNGGIGRLIKRHLEVISFSSKIERLFTYIALMQFLSSAVVICCIGFLIVISIGTAESTATLIKSVLFYIVISADAFVFCFAGEYLSTKSKIIGEASYASEWYDWSPEESRTLPLPILRSQRALTITIGKFMDLSLERFTTIVKASGSYLSVLLSMY